MLKTKLQTFKTAMKAPQYEKLSKYELKIYQAGFRNGYKLARNNIKKKIKHKPKKIINFQFNSTTPKNIDQIINKVCVRYEVHKKTLLGKCRTQDIVRARNIIHNILNDKYNMNLTNIGRYFGQDHTTVLHSIQMKANKERFWSPEQTIWDEYLDLIN
tara:strand:- start:35 stop:508 length:474 start_codon:yes stop_codon:yes gene_type:complete